MSLRGRFGAPTFRLGIPVLLGLASWLARPAFADSVVIAPSADNTLYQNTNGSLSNGAGAGMFAGRTMQASNFVRRAVIRFDVAGNVPAGSTINSAQLKLTMTMGNGGPTTVALRRLSQSWGEGTSDAGVGEGAGTAATANDVTWKNRFFPSSDWTLLGGDFSATVIASVSVDQENDYFWGSTPTLVADVQSMVADPASNFGWVVRASEAAVGSAKRFATKEDLVPENRPTLTLDYTPPGVPAFPATWGRVKGLYR